MSVRPLTDTLRLLDAGAFLDLASENMNNLVKRVEETGKAGKLVITIDVKRASAGAMAITPHVSAKIPEPKPDATLLWSTVEGNLTVDNPSQQKLDLRSVDQKTGEIRHVAEDRGALKTA
jgi:hypothetical protein